MKKVWIMNEELDAVQGIPASLAESVKANLE